MSNTIKPGEVTTPKIASYAVTESKLADNAVTVVKIKDGAVKTAKIGDKQVTGDKIADRSISTTKIIDGAITGTKIADGTITREKISDGVLGRPLTPPVAMVEIADNAVSEAKLQNNSVTTDKIKDNAITGRKIAANTITQGNIAANAVGSSEIRDGSVGTRELATDAVETVKVKNGAVTAPKIATDAVETDKIKDEAVTNPKIAPQSIGPWKLGDNALSARLVKNFLGGNSFFHDDFFGAALLPVWTVAGGGNASTGWVGMCGNLDISAPFGATETVNWNAKKNLNLDAVNPVFMVGLESVGAAVDDYITWRVTLLVDANNYVEFKAQDNAGVKPTWHARCVSGGVATDIDTTIPIEAGTGLDQHLRIEYTSTEVTFYINDVLVATIDTNIPTGCAEVQIELTNNHGTDDRYLTPDYVTLMGERP
jgi:hypothetical protein